jgi:Acetyltransferase (GNAT) domain
VDRIFLTPEQPTSLLYSDTNLKRANSASITHMSNICNQSHKSQSFRVETLTFNDAKTNEKDWNDLVDRCLEPNIFHEPRFILAATHHLSAAKRPFFIFIWQDNFDTNLPPTLMGVFPFFVSQLDLIVPVLRAWHNVNTALATPLIDKIQADNVITTLFNHVENTRYKTIFFPKLIETGLFSQALKRVVDARLGQLKFITQTNRAILACKIDGQSYIQQNWRSKKLKELQRQRRRLSDVAPVTLKTIDEQPEIIHAIERFLKLESAGWKGRNGTALSQKTAQSGFAKTMLHSFTADKKLEIHELYCGEKLVASGILLKSQGASYFWKITHDEAFAKFSPGVLLTQNLTQHCLNQSQPTNIDSCATANHPMINSLWVDKISIVDVFVAPSSHHNLNFKIAQIREKIKCTIYQASRALYIKLKRAKNN